MREDKLKTSGVELTKAVLEGAGYQMKFVGGNYCVFVNEDGDEKCVGFDDPTDPDYEPHGYRPDRKLLQAFELAGWAHRKACLGPFEFQEDGIGAAARFGYSDSRWAHCDDGEVDENWKEKAATAICRAVLVAMNTKDPSQPWSIEVKNTSI
jgi:hypothetical protein